MTDEEKEAIEWLKRLVKINKRDNLDNTFAEISLNLIEKQSKEIEELKEKKGYHLGFIDGGIAKKYEIQDKIKAKIEEVKDGTYDAKIVLQSLLEKE